MLMTAMYNLIDASPKESVSTSKDIFRKVAMVNFPVQFWAIWSQMVSTVTQLKRLITFIVYHSTSQTEVD